MYIIVHWMVLCVSIQIPETSKPNMWCHVLEAFKKVIGVNASEIQLNLCMHFLKFFRYGYLNTSDSLSKELLQKLNRVKVIKDNKGHA